MIENHVVPQGEKPGGHLPDQIVNPVKVFLKVFGGRVSSIQSDHPLVMAEENRGMVSFQKFREGGFPSSDETAEQVQGHHSKSEWVITEEIHNWMDTNRIKGIEIVMDAYSVSVSVVKPVRAVATSISGQHASTRPKISRTIVSSSFTASTDPF